MMIMETKDITKHFKYGVNIVKALDGISIKIEEGEMVAIMGRSGSGKTTLMNILGKFDAQSKGNYFYKRENVSKFDDQKAAKFRNENIGFVVQNFALINDYSVYENVRLPLEYSKKIKKRQYKTKIEETLKRVGISHKAQYLAADLSGGEKQRVAIARALVNNPDILIADEPTGALDVETATDIISLFKELNQNGMTIIIVTHDIDVASACSRIIKLLDGKVVE